MPLVNLCHYDTDDLMTREKLTAIDK